MKLEMTSDEIKHGLRTGCSFEPTTPGLQIVALELSRPIIEKMDGREIVYVCRFYWLLRVDFLEISDEGFRDHGTPAHDLDNRMFP
jgi:hypothetical protein